MFFWKSYFPPAAAETKIGKHLYAPSGKEASWSMVKCTHWTWSFTEEWKEQWEEARKMEGGST